MEDPAAVADGPDVVAAGSRDGVQLIDPAVGPAVAALPIVAVGAIRPAAAVEMDDRSGKADRPDVVAAAAPDRVQVAVLGRVARRPATAVVAQDGLAADGPHVVAGAAPDRPHWHPAPIGDERLFPEARSRGITRLQCRRSSSSRAKNTSVFIEAMMFMAVRPHSPRQNRIHMPEPTISISQFVQQLRQDLQNAMLQAHGAGLVFLLEEV